MTRKLYIGLAAVALLSACFSLGAAAQSTPQTTGPYKVVMEMDPALPRHTIYRPQDLAGVKDKMPVIAFGNGGCGDSGNGFANYLSEVASYGFVAVANGPINPNFNWSPNGTRTPEGKTTTSQLFETMDWTKSQTEDKAGKYYGKLDAGSIAVMGQSCGGLQALEAAGDPRVKAVVVLNSGIVRSAAPAGIGPLPGSVESLAKLHTPVIYIIGGETDVAHPNAEKDFVEIQNLPVFKANLTGAGHGGTIAQPHGGKFGEVLIQWLLWQLKKDKKASAWFLGESCGL
jgi:dienelactone hydrolase